MSGNSRFTKIKQEMVNEHWVSTVALGDYFGDGRDWYETMVFSAPDGNIDFLEVWGERCVGLNSALVLHERGVKKAQALLLPGWRD